MIMTILKQTTCFYLGEKDYAIANVYADLYSQMIIQYINMKEQAVIALKDLALDFYNHNLFRSAEKYYLLIEKTYGKEALSAQDFLTLGKIEEKLNHINSALNNYQEILKSHKNSAYIKDAYDNIIRIFKLCGNKYKADEIKNIYALQKLKARSHKRKQIKKAIHNKK